MKSLFTLRPIVLGLVVVVILRTVPAQAAPRDYETTINRGRDHMAAGDYDKALAAFQEAHALSPTPRTTAQMGLAMQAMGSWIEAAGKLEEALRESSDRWIVRNRGPLTTSLETVSGHLAELVLRLPKERPQDMQVRIVNTDRAVTDVDGKPVRVVSGPVVVRVQAPGYRPFEFRAEASARTRLEIVVELQALATAPPVPPVTASLTAPVPVRPEGDRIQPPGPRSTSRWVLSIIGLGLGVGSGAMGAYWLGIHGDGDCGMPPCRYYKDTRTQGWVALGLGTVLIVGSSLYLTGSDSDSPRLAIVATPSHLGMTAFSRF